MVGYFTRRRVLKNKTRRKELQSLQEKTAFFLSKVERATSLTEVFILHIQMWGSGIQTKNIGPNMQGFFRTLDILRMTPDGVYLGNTCGINTHPISYWNQYEGTEGYKSVLKQYKSVLKGELKWLGKGLEDLLNKK